MAQLPVALEITPPRTPNPRVLLRRARALPRAERINVIHRRDRQSSLDACLDLAAEGLHPVWHRCAREAGARGAEELERARLAGLDQVLCLLGEKNAATVDPPKIHELVTATRIALPDAQISVSFDPHHPTPRAFDNLARKLDAGASAVQTQLVFEAATLDPLVTWLERRATPVELWPMVVPVLVPAEAERLRRRLDLRIPEALEREIELYGPAGGWRAFADWLAALAEIPLVTATVIMTLPMDADAAYAKELGASVA